MARRSMRVGIVGAGVMAEAIIGGLVANRADPSGILASHPRRERREALAARERRMEIAFDQLRAEQQELRTVVAVLRQSQHDLVRRGGPLGPPDTAAAGAGEPKGSPLRPETSSEALSAKYVGFEDQFRAWIGQALEWLGEIGFRSDHANGDRTIALLGTGRQGQGRCERKDGQRPRPSPPASIRRSGHSDAMPGSRAIAMGRRMTKLAPLRSSSRSPMLMRPW